jgi:hemolysin D
LEYEAFKWAVRVIVSAKASIKTDEINVDGKWVKLKPGISVTVEIKTGTRQLMEFLLAPLMRGVSEGARER